MYTSDFKVARTALAMVLVLGMSMAPLTSVHAGVLLSAKDRAKAAEKSERADTVVGQWLMSYYVGYQHDYLKPRDVDYSLMTHIVVGGVGVGADGSLDEHWHMKNGDGREMAEDVGRRAQKAGVKTLIWLGGPNEENDYYSASSDKIRDKFVDNIIDLVHELDYDGVDVNWEPIRAQDQERILALVRDLRKADPDLIITVPVNWVQTTMIDKKDLSLFEDLAKYADRLFIMSYSMAGPWPGWRAWHGAALYGDMLTTPGSVSTSVLAYTRAGVPEEKLGIGIGTYATCWESPIKRPKQTVPTGYVPGMLGTMSMRTLMDDYYVKKYEKWDSHAKVPYLSFSRPRGEWDCGFISYENEASVQEKMNFVKEEGLGGAMIWNIGTGYYPDASRSKRHPLLKTAWETLQATP